MAQRNRGVSLKPGKSRAALTITHPNAAGIDIGSASHFVAVPPDRDDEPVREFASFTVDLNAIAAWLQACGVDTVAMESTGVYWIPLFELLESRGFTVFLVNARHVKNVSGRKSDVLDCTGHEGALDRAGLQQLMTYGLLSAAFRPDEQVCVLRALARQREMLLKAQARHVQHMQKALTQMNIQLANVISDVVGVTGQKILRAIVAGQRDGLALAACKDVRIHASAEDIAKQPRHADTLAVNLLPLAWLAASPTCPPRAAACHRGCAACAGSARRCRSCGAGCGSRPRSRVQTPGSA
jgi:transposase